MEAVEQVDRGGCAQGSIVGIRPFCSGSVSFSDLEGVVPAIGCDGRFLFFGRGSLAQSSERTPIPVRGRLPSAPPFGSKAGRPSVFHRSRRVDLALVPRIGWSDEGTRRLPRRCPGAHGRVPRNDGYRSGPAESRGSGPRLTSGRGRCASDARDSRYEHHGFPSVPRQPRVGDSHCTAMVVPVVVISVIVPVVSCRWCHAGGCMPVVVMPVVVMPVVSCRWCHAGGCHAGGCHAGGCHAGGCHAGGCHAGGCHVE